MTLVLVRSRDVAQTGRLSAAAQSLGYLLAATGPLAVGLLHEATDGWTAGLVLLLACWSVSSRSAWSPPAPAWCADRRLRGSRPAAATCGISGRSRRPAEVDRVGHRGADHAVQVAGGQLTGRPDRLQRRVDGRARLEGVRAAGPEPAAAGDGGRRGDVAAQHDPPPLPAPGPGAAPGRRTAAPACTASAASRADGRRRPDLHDPAQVHDRDPVGQVPDGGQVVRDEQQREAELALQPPQQVEHLRLHADVEGGDRLVADQEVRLPRERPGDAHPLPLAAGELVRVAAGDRRVQADQLQQLADPGGALAAVRRAGRAPRAARPRSAPPSAAGRGRRTGPGRPSRPDGASSSARAGRAR